MWSVAVESLPVLEVVVVAGKCERARQRHVGQPPAGRAGCPVVRRPARRCESASRGALRHRRVVVSAIAKGLTRRDVREAADP